MDVNRAENKNTSFDISSIVGGAPINLSAKEAKSFAEHALNLTDSNTSENTKINLIRSGISKNGSEMYSACLNAYRPAVVSFTDAAYNNDDFFVTVQWTPREVESPPTAQASVRVLGATIEGPSSQRLPRNGSFSVHIKRSDLPVQIVVSVHGQEQPIIDLPKRIRTKFTQRQRSLLDGEGKDEIAQASEDGSSAGMGPNNKTACVNAGNDGFLVPSTLTPRIISMTGGASWNPGSKYIPPNEQTQPDNTPQRVCATVHTGGSGRKPTRYEIRAKFNVLEIVQANSR
jgi:hypothetical protein